MIATSSTEAEFIGAVSATKSIKYLHTVLHKFGFPYTSLTHMFIDNKAAIKMINQDHPTKWSRHIDIQFYALSEWQK